MTDKYRVISFSLKPRDIKGRELVRLTKETIAKEGLESFSSVMMAALSEYMERHYEIGK